MKKILVIEDEQSIRLNILKILKFENFESIEAENGEIGVKLAQEQKPDLILCDIMMPVLDGYGVRKALCQDPTTETIPFIFLTAKADRADMRLAMSLGADDYLTKPFSREELLEAILARLAKQAAVHEQFHEKLDQLKGGIATSLPAELFIPLQKVRSFLEKIHREGAALTHSTLLPEAKESYDASLCLERLLQNFLLYALLEITTQDPSQAAAFRGKCTTESADLIAEIAKQKAKEFGRDTDLNLQLQPATLPILAANLAKIVEELLDNAFKFSLPGSVVQVSSSLEHDQFLLKITDHGQGLSKQELENIGTFVQFGQKLNGQGSAGLGLAVTEKLALLHDGVLELNSEPLKYTTAQVSLPIYR
jgi:two-component system, sensor histidine kinase and response regulator